MALKPDPTRYESSDQQWAAEAREAEKHMRVPLGPIAMFGCIAGLLLWSLVLDPFAPQPTKDP